MIASTTPPTFDARISATEMRFQARADLRRADASFADAITHVQAMPLDEAPDADGPFGAACSATLEGIEALESAAERDSTGTAFDAPKAQSALADAAAARDLLWHWEANGWSAGEPQPTKAVVDATTRLLVSARASIEDALTPTS